MELFNEPIITPAEIFKQILHLPGNKEVTLTFAGAGNPSLEAAKEILVQHSVKKLLNKGFVS